MGCSCAGEITTSEGNIITEITNQWNDWYQTIADFEMELGAGLEAIAAAWTECCNLPYTAMIDVPNGFMTVTNPDGSTTTTVTTTPVSVAGAGAYTQAWDSLLWNQQMNNWINSYNDWQTTQQAIAVGQLALYFVQLGSFIDAYKDFQECANEAQADLKAVMAEISTVATKARDDYSTHVDDAATNKPFTWAQIASQIVEVCELSDEFKNQASEACFGYDKIQKDHIQNMGTHLAQLCTNARDVSNDLKVCLQELDGAWLAGGVWDEYEQSLFGGGSLGEYLAQSHTLGEELSTSLQDCGELLMNCYVEEGGGGDFFETIKPALTAMIEQMTLADGVLADLRDASSSALECSQQIKENFDAVYAAQEAGGGATDKIMGIANDLFCSPEGGTFIKDCLTTLQSCIVDNKDILDRYVGEEVAAGGGASGEYCLGRVIIDQACGLVNDLQDAVTFLDEHSDNCLADYAASYQTKEGTLALTLLNSACDLAQCVQATHTWFGNHAEQLELCWAEAYAGEKLFVASALAEADELVKQHSDTLQCLLDCADEAKTCYTMNYLADEKLTAELIHDNAQTLAPCVPETHTWLVTQADQLEACWVEGYTGEKLFASDALSEATELNEEHAEVYACLKDCLDQAKTCYTDFYLPEEKATALEIHDNAQELADCVPVTHNWMVTHTDQLEACWAVAYTGEKDYAIQALQESLDLNPNHSDIYTCLKDCLDEAKTCYTDFYLLEEKATALEIHDNAQELADCLPLAHNWLCDQADKNRDRYCEFWAPKEDVYVCAILDKAIELACESKDCLADWCEQLEDKWDWWMECFQDAEKQTIPKLITAAVEACEKNELTYFNACERSDELYEKYMTEWCPCDIEDLQYHCAIWDKVNMLEEICDANACLRTTAEVLKECYDEMLNCEKEYLQFVCDMSYDPKYCDMEARAVAHVKKQYETQIAELEQCIPPWCQAAYLDRVVDMRHDQANAESVSIQIADRWEWLRNVHEEDRKHNYLQDIIRNFGEKWIENSHEMYRSVQQGNDLILRHVHDRIVRGRLYLESSFGHLDRTLTALNQTVGNGIQATNTSHFWADWYNQGKNSYVNNSINYLNTSNDILRLGHDVYRQASDDKVNAAQIARGAVQDGLATIDRGHAVKQRALDSATRADNIIQGTDQNAVNLIQQGHNLHRMAADAQAQAARIAETAVQAGLATIDRGHAVKQRALDSATRANNVLESTDSVALNLIQQGHNLHAMARDAESRASQIALEATQQGLQTIDRGHRVKEHAMDAAARADAIITNLDQTATNLIQQGHNLHRMASDDQNRAGQIALEATQQGLQTIDRGHRVKQMALDAATQQGSLAHQGIQDGLAGIDRGHFWAEMSQRGIDSKLQGFSDTWRNTVQHLQHGQNYLSTAARWGDVANTALRNEVSVSEIGLTNSLGWFNTAQRKLETVLDSQNDHVREAIQMLGQGHNRMNTVLDAKTATQAQIRASTDGMVNMAQVGNQFHYAAADATQRGAAMKKEALMCVCDLIRNRFNDVQGMEIGLGSSIMGSSYNASQNALGQIQGLLNGIGSAFQQLAGPPPTIPFGQVGFGNSGYNYQTGAGTTGPNGLPGSF